MTGKFFAYLLCCALFASVFIENVNAKSYKSSRHSYPSSHGSSGSHRSSSSVHSYPSHGGLSGGGGGSSVTRHNYPTAAASPHSSLSGSGSHSYPSAPVHTYPVSSGSAHSYPSSNSLSGSGSIHNYPSSHGLSGNKPSASNYPHPSYPQNNNYYPSNTVHQSSNWGYKPDTHHHYSTSQTVHHHYHYRPPTVIHYTSSYGVSPMSYPVYTGHLPQYVYEYRSSNNRYSTLLAGLALYNLGRMSANPGMHNYHKHYIPQPDEKCTFGVRYRYGNYDEMLVDCRAITNFIYEDQMQPQTQTHVTTNIVNQTTVTTNTQNQVMLANGALANVNTQPIITNNGQVVPNTQQVLAGNGQVIQNQPVLMGNGQLAPNTQQVNTVTTTQVVSVTDTKLAGKPVEVNPDMECYVTRRTSFTNMRKAVPCGLLQTYTAQSLRSSVATFKASFTTILIAVGFLLF